MIGFILKKIFGSVNDRMIKSLTPIIKEINNFEPVLEKLSDQELKNKTIEFKEKLKDGSSLDSILPESFAVVREASKRVLSMRHFDVQLIGGIILHQGKIAEMRTGEGKTLVSTLACYLNALTGHGVHVVTVNDYLAKRDSEWMGRIHKFLGLSIGCIVHDTSDEDRKDAYNCDITYATNNELGFDYLRDNMKFFKENMYQKGHNFAVIDEVDSILIDEARTPLIISGAVNDNSDIYTKVNKIIPKLLQTDYQLEEKDRNIFLSDTGVESAEKLLKEYKVIDDNSSLYDIENITIVHHINQALKAHKMFKNEIDYIVKDGSILIIDEFTGRIQDGRRFSNGLHQALEAKENVKIKNENQTLASITFQNYFRLYKKISGMTGTATTESVEFREIYKLEVIEVPTNKTVMRKDEDDEIYKTEQEKYDAIIKVIQDCIARKQPMLVGTISIEKSELISKILKKHKIPHNILNAKYHEQEAYIIAQAGIPSAVTIATNMAGRGTDIQLGGNIEMIIKELKLKIKDKDLLEKEIIKLKDKFEKDKETVLKAGGLYVLSTERHESRRIDNQLRGRSGRQGDPGVSKFFLSLEDDLMRIFGSDKLQAMLSTLGLKNGEAIFHPWISKTLAKAQMKVESKNYEMRKNLIKYDDVINEQRKIIFEKRMEIINSEDVTEEIYKISQDINYNIIINNVPKKSYKEQWNIESIINEIKRIYSIDLDIKSFVEKENTTEDMLIDFIDQETKNFLIQRQEEYGSEIEIQLRRQIFLMILDSKWKDHLLSLDKLKNGINLRAYAQKDPLIEYKKDAFALFEDMLDNIEEKTLNRISYARIRDEEEDKKLESLKMMPYNKYNVSEQKNNINSVLSNKKTRSQEMIRNNINPEDRDPKDISTWGNVRRNEPCPCQSGKKYKQCHGKIV